MADENSIPEEVENVEASEAPAATESESPAAEPVEEVSAEGEGEAVEGAETVEEAAEPEEPLSPEDLEFSDDEIITEDDEEWDEDEDASPIEEFVEPVKEVDVSALEMDWYILKVQVNREKSICETLRRQVRMNSMQDYFSDILVPTEDVREFTKAGKPKIVKRKLYPGYIVVRMAITDESWFLVRDTSGIGDFAGAAGRPVALSPEEVERIISTSRPAEADDGEEAIKTAIPFKVGDRVRVKEGYFQNYEGDISFGRNNPVDMDHWHVEKFN